MTHDELLKTIDAHIAIGYAASGFSEYAAEGTLCEKALRAVAELCKELSKTDYRGNPPVEHRIAREILETIEKELG